MICLLPNLLGLGFVAVTMVTSVPFGILIEGNIGEAEEH